MAKRIAKAAEVAAPKKFMYVGPTIRGVAVQNTIYEGTVDGIEELKKRVPEAANLCISVSEYPEAERSLSTGRGYIASAFKKVLASSQKGE